MYFLTIEFFGNYKCASYRTEKCIGLYSLPIYFSKRFLHVIHYPNERNLFHINVIGDQKHSTISRGLLCTSSFKLHIKSRILIIYIKIEILYNYIYVMVICIISDKFVLVQICFVQPVLEFDIEQC